MPRSEEDRNADIVESCDRIAAFIAGMTFESFRADERTVRAVLYELIVIGEAAKSIGEQTRARFSEIPWQRVAGLRDIAVHQYHGVMLDLIWDTVTIRVPELGQTLSSA